MRYRQSIPRPRIIKPRLSYPSMSQLIATAVTTAVRMTPAVSIFARENSWRSDGSFANVPEICLASLAASRSACPPARTLPIWPSAPNDVNCPFDLCSKPFSAASRKYCVFICDPYRERCFSLHRQDELGLKHQRRLMTVCSYFFIGVAMTLRVCIINEMRLRWSLVVSSFILHPYFKGARLKTRSQQFSPELVIAGQI